MNLSPSQAADLLRKRLSAGPSRIDVLEAAAAMRCRVSFKRISATRTVEADLCPDTRRDLFFLRVDPEPPAGWGGTSSTSRATIARHRSRFRVCHELGHTFFYDRQKGKGPCRSQRWTAQEEEWCDEFARSLLVPTNVARGLVPAADGVFALQRRFDVSLEVAARALASAHPQATVAVWYWPQGAAEPSESLLRQWVSCETRALRQWRESTVVDQALIDGGAAGPLADLRHTAASLMATARCNRQRRQIVAVAV